MLRWSYNKFKAKLIDWLMRDTTPLSKFPLCDFERLQYEIRPCDVLLIEGRSRVSEAIRNITRSSWTHSAIYIGRLYDLPDSQLREQILKYYKGDPESQLIIESVLGQGAIVSPLAVYQREHIRICRPKGISLDDVHQVIAYCIKRLGKPYAVRGIFDLYRFLLPYPFLPRRWRSSLFSYNAGEAARESCASLLVEAFESVYFPVLPIVLRREDSGVQLIRRNPRLYTPNAFDYSPFFEIIKYPMYGLSMMEIYRNLPWEKGIALDDEGSVILPLNTTAAEPPGSAPLKASSFR